MKERLFMTSLAEKFLEYIKNAKRFNIAKITTPKGASHKAEILFLNEAFPPEEVGPLFDKAIKNKKLFPLFPDFLRKQIKLALFICEKHGYKQANINIPIEVFEHTCRDDVLRALKHVKTPEKICLELTENSKIKTPSALKDIFNKLSGLGYEFVLDDLGTGFYDLTKNANKTYVAKLLQACPIKGIKIDYTLAKDFDKNFDRIRENIEFFEELYEELGHDIQDLSVTFEAVLTDEQYKKARAITRTKTHYFQKHAIK